MRFILAAPVIILLSTLFATHSRSDGLGEPSDDAGQFVSVDREQEARKKFEQLEARFQAEIEGLKKQIAAASTPGEKQQLFRDGNPLPRHATRLLELAREYNDTRAGVDAVLLAYEKGQGETSDAAMDLMTGEMASRVNLKKVSASFHQVVPSQKVEGWYRAMMKNASSRSERAAVMFNFFTYFDQFGTFNGALDHSPELAARLPAAQLKYIRNRASEMRPELEKLLQQLVDEYGELENRGERYEVCAANALYELKYLQVGMVVPELEGEDLDGAKFRLSDYRGRVVMLDFWGHWCPPCRAMYDHERKLVEALSDKPFVLIGVNSDPKLDYVRNVVRDHDLTWRNFWNGPRGRKGPISQRWNVAAWPSVYLIDAEGVIRYKEVLGSDIDEGLQVLLAELGHEVDLANLE